MVKKIIYVSLVETYFHMQENWRDTLMQFTKVKKITCDSCGKSFSQSENTLIQFIMDEKITRENSIFSSPKDKEKQ